MAASRTQSVAVKEEPYKAYVVMDARNGKILEGENIHLKRAPASVVKLMVAYLVLEKAIPRGSEIIGSDNHY